jgi:RNA polymerase sigma factor (sigma-70 family)
MNQPSVRTRQQIDQVFTALYEAKSPESSSLFSYIQRLLGQFRLKTAYEVKDILVEVYARGIVALAKGKTIDNPQAWIKRVALNVIREFRRDADRVEYNSLDEQPYLAASAEDHLSKMILEDDAKIILQAFESLSEDDRFILDLRIVHGLSWQEISEHMAIQGIDVTENALRQKGFRALRRLRSFYDSKEEIFQSLPDQKSAATSSLELIAE